MVLKINIDKKRHFHKYALYAIRISYFHKHPIEGRSINSNNLKNQKPNTKCTTEIVPPKTLQCLQGKN